MSDDTRNEDPKPAEKKTTTPPWGKDEDFDPARAWSLIENLRTEVEDLKTAKKDLEADRQAREDAEKTEAEKAADRAKQAEERAEQAERALYVERAVRKHEIPDDLVEFLTGSTEEEINERAERLSKSLGKDGSEQERKHEEPGDDGRPTPALTPGHGGDAPEHFDAAAIAQAARESAY